jgi:hypothetical protein
MTSSAIADKTAALVRAKKKKGVSQKGRVASKKKK